MTDRWGALEDFDTADVDPETLESGALNDIAAKIAQKFNRRVEREAVAAWMAGYEALDVTQPTMGPTNALADPESALKLKAAFTPINAADVDPAVPEGHVVKRYDVTELTPDMASELRRKWNDAEDTDDA